MKHKTTIYDIARYLKISPASVSYVLNNKPKVSQKTREAVLKAIKELGYSLDYKGLALSTGKTRVVALFLPSKEISSALLENQFYAEFIGFFQSNLQCNNYDLIIKSLSDEKNFLDWAKNRGIDCAVFIGRFTENYYKALLELEIPAVLVDFYDEYSKKFVTVRSNDEEGTYLATKELLNNNHKEIVFISGDIKVSKVDETRFNGYARALRENNIEIKDELVYTCEPSFNGGLNFAKELVKNKNITGVVCAADIIAIGLVKGLQDLGYKVPEDYSVVGFDDIQMASLITPALTTINQDISKKADLVAELALKVLNGQKVEKDLHIIEPVLVRRNSVNKIN